MCQLSYAQPPAERFMQLFRSENLLDFALPYLLAYLALPLLIFSVLYLGKYLSNKMPKLTYSYNSNDYWYNLHRWNIWFLAFIYGDW